MRHEQAPVSAERMLPSAKPGFCGLPNNSCWFQSDGTKNSRQPAPTSHDFGDSFSNPDSPQSPHDGIHRPTVYEGGMAFAPQLSCGAKRVVVQLGNPAFHPCFPTYMSTESERDNRGRRDRRGGRRRRYGRNDDRPHNRDREHRSGGCEKSTGIWGFIKNLFGFGKKSKSCCQHKEREVSYSDRPERASSSEGEGHAENSNVSPRISRMLEETPEVVSAKLYVGNLNYEVSESDLFDLFSQVGAVKNVEIVRDRSSRSKGFGFVEMQELDTAKAASQKFHRVDLQGRPLIVSGAKSS